MEWEEERFEVVWIAGAETSLVEVDRKSFVGGDNAKAPYLPLKYNYYL